MNGCSSDWGWVVLVLVAQEADKRAKEKAKRERAAAMKEKEAAKKEKVRGGVGATDQPRG